ncbi:MAG: DUF2905 domain-containing protein [Verrucomicrobiae bacterium]|nr:DUF2905 domain-containing protein [Verrucomicrobiae bacterium]
MNEFGKLIFIIGSVIATLGLLIWFLGGKRVGGLLPGDIFIDKGNFKFYFPIVTCIVLSVILTIILSLLKK